MKPFLQRLASVLVESHPDGLDKIAVVLPGRRAGLYLRKYLSEVMGRTFWSPDLLDMGEFMELITRMRQGNTMELLFLLYKAHRELAGPDAEPLNEFLSWAPITLRDMSEVDGHLLDLDKLYRDLRSYHEIEEWSFRLEPLSVGQERQMALWKKTGALHQRFLEIMSENGLGTSGSLARRAVEAIGTTSFQSPWKMVWFAGLNALEPAASSVVGQLQQRGSAKVAWDADLHYLNDPEQEAGHFLRRSIRKLGSGEIPPVEAIRELPRSFISVAVPDRLSQAKYASQYLAELTKEELNDTAIVLADEDLLLPLLEALPPELGPVNVTMGMTLDSLPIHGLVEAFLEMHSRMGADGSIRTDDIERLLLHPFLHRGDPSVVALEKLRDNGFPYQEGRSVMDLLHKLGVITDAGMTALFMPIDLGLVDLRDKLNALLTWAHSLDRNDRFNQEQLFRVARLHERLHAALDRSKINPPDLRTYITLRTRLLREERIGFYGEPLHGPQIMGMLETRAIDHRRVIVLSAQEGILPGANSDRTWIPFDIRRVHGLPLPADTVSITAYHFYRLMQLTQEVHLVHGPGNGSMISEPSRFIAQWNHEVVGHTATAGQATTLLAKTPIRRAPAIQVAKGVAVMKRLDEVAARGFSPSALGTWLRCPLDFWIKYGLGVKQANEVDDRLASDVLGSAVHRVLEVIHQPWLGVPLEAGALIEAAGNTKQLLHSELSQHFPGRTLDRGHFRLRLDMAAKALSDHLLAEAERCARDPSTVFALELDVEARLQDGMRIRGRCDRIEERAGILHVLDMKTGSVEPELLKLRSLDREEIGPRKQQAFQLLVYAAMYLHVHAETEVVRAGIIPLQKRSLSDGIMLSIGNSEEVHRSMLPEINTLVSGLIQDLMDPTQPFIHQPASQWCSSCIN